MQKEECQITHFLDLRLSVDLMQLYLPDNISGVKVALGVSSEQDIANAYASQLVGVIEHALGGYGTTKVAQVNLSPVEGTEELVAPPIQDEPNNPETKEFIVDNESELIWQNIENHCFNIEEEMGDVISIIVKDSAFLDILDYKVDNMYRGDVDLIVREDLDCNFMIRYRNINNIITEMKEVV